LTPKDSLDVAIVIPFASAPRRPQGFALTRAWKPPWPTSAALQTLSPHMPGPYRPIRVRRCRRTESQAWHQRLRRRQHQRTDASAARIRSRLQFVCHELPGRGHPRPCCSEAARCCGSPMASWPLVELRIRNRTGARARCPAPLAQTLLKSTEQPWRIFPSSRLPDQLAALADAGFRAPPRGRRPTTATRVMGHKPVDGPPLQPGQDIIPAWRTTCSHSAPRTGNGMAAPGADRSHIEHSPSLA